MTKRHRQYGAAIFLTIIFMLTDAKIGNLLQVFADNDSKESQTEPAEFFPDSAYIEPTDNMPQWLNRDNIKEGILTFVVHGLDDEEMVLYEISKCNQEDWKIENTLIADENSGQYQIPVGQILKDSIPESHRDGQYEVNIYTADRSICIGAVYVYLDTAPPEYTLKYGADSVWRTSGGIENLTVCEIRDATSGIRTDHMDFKLYDETGQSILAEFSHDVNSNYLMIDETTETVTLNLKKYTADEKIPDGKYQIRFEVEDEAGNLAAAAPVNLWFQNEAIRFQCNDTQFHNQWIDIAKRQTNIIVSEIEPGVSGLKDVHVKIGNMDCSGYLQQERGTYVLDVTKQCADGLIWEDGSYDVVITVTNEAGMKSQMLRTLKIDRTAPVIGIPVFSGAAKVRDSYYSNMEVQILCDISDRGSGIQQVCLMDDRNQIISKAFVENGKYKIILAESGTYQGYKIMAVDSVGHTREQMLDRIVITREKASIMPVYEPGTMLGGKCWYSQDTMLQFAVRSELAGIASVMITCNGTELLHIIYRDTDQLLTSETYQVFTGGDKKAKPKIKEDCSYMFAVTIKDFAGNTTCQECTIYKDAKAPMLSAFQFKGMDKTEITKTPAAAYGYFFREDTEVVIFAEDGEKESGIDKISFYTIREDGVRSPIETKTTRNGSAIFTIRAGFQGYIYAYATDKLDNQTKSAKLAGAIIETETMHEKCEHIKFQKPDARKKDLAGQELYRKDVPVTIQVQDSCSGIQELSWNVISDDPDAEIICGAVQFDTKGSITGDTGETKSKRNNAGLVVYLEKTILVAADSNHIHLLVKMTDHAGNVSEEKLEFGIDKTAPKILVTYDNNHSDQLNATVFRTGRVATISIQERNFHPEDVRLTIWNSKARIFRTLKWKRAEGEKNENAPIYTATIPYTEDGDYTWSIRYTDMAGNAGMIEYGNSVAPESFTIDQTSPAVKLVYDKNNGRNDFYYQDRRKAVITIVEHNFQADRVRLKIYKNGRGKDRTIGQWSHHGDVHTAVLIFQEEAEYQLSIAVEDMAGNRADSLVHDKFVIDGAAPSLSITGVGQNQAYVQERLPISITAEDIYLDSFHTVLTKTDSKGESAEIPMKKSGISGSISYKIDNLTEDGLYRLHCMAMDKSGKITEQTVLFAVNRNGSVYMVDGYLSEICGKANQNITKDVIITELNVNRLNLQKSSVLLYYGYHTMALKEGRDYQVQEIVKDGRWSTYIYKIFQKNFTRDGHYSISITSTDIQQNTSNNEEEGKVGEIFFTVDRTAPIGILNDLNSNHTYALSQKDVTYNVIDNMELRSVTVYVNGIQLHTLSGEELTEDNMKFTLHESSAPQEIIVHCVDLAGNESKTTISGVYITASPTAKSENKMLYIGSAILVLILLIVCVTILVRKNGTY